MTDCVVTITELGQIEGLKQQSALRCEYYSFLGVPFAKPPVGNRRFKDPEPLEKWEGILKATSEKSSSIGFNSLLGAYIGNEDCLTLNIYTKDLKPEKAHPVIVYLHGGAFSSGSNSKDIYGPDYLFEADVILVCVNYRLGPLGFLCMKDKDLGVPGNAGLKDQRLALKWVQDNIKYFGGDACNVTLMGESAGAASAHLHCVSDGSKGLFQRAIIMSGCALHNWSLIPDCDWAERLAKALGWNGIGGEKELLEFLQNADPFAMVELQKSLITEKEAGRVAFPFGPHIEHYVTSSTFISEDTLALCRKAWSSDIDILMGGTSDEGLMYLKNIKENPSLITSFSLENAVSKDFDINASDPRCINFAKQLKTMYYPTTEPSKDEMGFCRFMTDRVFAHGMYRTVLSRQHTNGKGLTFLYRFNMDSPTQNHYRIRTLGPEVRGTCHADDICYVFKNSYYPVPNKDSIEFETIERFVFALTSFASCGQPIIKPSKTDTKNIDWKPVETTESPLKCLNISNIFTIMDLPETERLTHWNSMYKEMNIPLY